MPTDERSRATSAEQEARRSPFPRYERVTERLADEPTAGTDGPREVEVPRTESYGELWRRAQARRMRSR
jgi:hypothetical protein